jgi:hypothetical protein
MPTGWPSWRTSAASCSPRSRTSSASTRPATSTTADYATLKDGYTARAAAVLRAIDEGRRARPPGPQRQWGRIAAAMGALAVVALGLGLLVAHFAGQRLPGQTVSGGIAEDTNSRLAQARALLGTDPARSLLLYEAVKEVDPDNVEATTYLGWLLLGPGRQHRLGRLHHAGRRAPRRRHHARPEAGRRGTASRPSCASAS